MADAIDELLEGINRSIVKQNERIRDIERIRDFLTRAETAPSLEETRLLLAAGLTDLKKLVVVEVERHKELRVSHDEYTARLRAKLDLVERQSRTDSLTGVANRSGIEKHMKAVLDHCRTNRTSYSFALLDLDGFKAINDRLGHQAGDAALVSFGQRLQAAVGNQAFVGRLGGDEFVVISASDAEVLGLLLHRLNENLEQRPVVYEGRPLRVACSFGVQPISPVVTFEEIHRAADAELYRAKQIRKSGKAA
jgi:diguanylate cyclase (GGDEF)-like protein